MLRKVREVDRVRVMQIPGTDADTRGDHLMRFADQHKKGLVYESPSRLFA